MATSVRAANMMIRFSDIIVKSKRIVEGRGNDGAARISREKLRKQHEEAKAVIEARAMRQRARVQERLSLEKMAEEAKSNYYNSHSAATELVNLCGGSRMSRDRSLFKKLGLVLKPDGDCDDDFYLVTSPPSPNHDDDDDLEEVIMQRSTSRYMSSISVYSFILQRGEGKLITLSHSRVSHALEPSPIDETLKLEAVFLKTASFCISSWFFFWKVIASDFVGATPSSLTT